MMTFRSISPVIRLSLIMPCLLACIAEAPAEDSPVRRLRGVVDRDDTWSGHVMITDDLQILGATITVLPGTLIEFALARRDEHPTLTVGSENKDWGELVFQATQDDPIVIRTRPGTNTGRLVVFLRNRSVSAFPLRPTNERGNKAAVVKWRHVRIENLGGKPPRRPATSGTHNQEEPAVTFSLVGASHSLDISDCGFIDATRMKISVSERSKIRVENNRFLNSKDRVSIEIDGSRIDDAADSIVVDRNHAESAIVVANARAEVTSNFLAGLNASIVVRASGARRTRVFGNYIRNTTPDNDGRYCFNTDISDVIVENNIFRGGTTCVLNGSRWMTGNVMIGEPDLSQKGVKQSQTHRLVAGLPVDAHFERNLLLGPAHSLLVPQPTRRRSGPAVSGARTKIVNNVFDGFGRSNRAIHVNPVGRLPTKIMVASNLFVRVPSLIYDEAGSQTTFVFADCNASAPLPARAFENFTVDGVKRGDEGWSSRDVFRRSISALGLNESLPTRISDYDQGIRSGRLSIEAFRQDLFGIYRPRPDSPLVGSGCLMGDGHRRSIGASEPVRR
ncbi:MAG: hypothetical protein MI923_07930 [Phycisphaerales bacterium]|nr:hypothetical protein [Phycisphaerales bacterium]